MSVPDRSQYISMETDVPIRLGPVERNVFGSDWLVTYGRHWSLTTDLPLKGQIYLRQQGPLRRLPKYGELIIAVTPQDPGIIVIDTKDKSLPNTDLLTLLKDPEYIVSSIAHALRA